MDIGFHLPGHGLAANGLHDQEQQAAAVQPGNGQQIEQPQVHGDHGQQFAEGDHGFQLGILGGPLGFLRDELHDAHRAGGFLEALAGGDQILEAAEDGPARPDAVIRAQLHGPGNAHRRVGRGILDTHAHAHQIAALFFVVFGDQLQGQGRISPQQADGQGRVPGLIAVHQHGEHVFAIGGQARCVHAVDGGDHIALPQAGRRRGAAFGNGLHHRAAEFAARIFAHQAKQPGRHDQRQQEIHPRPQQHGDEPLPHGIIADGPGIVLRFLALGIVFAVKHAVAADEKQPQEKPGFVLFAFPGNQFGAKANGKFLYRDARGPGGEEMPGLMDRHHDAQHQDGGENIQRCGHNRSFCLLS